MGKVVAIVPAAGRGKRMAGRENKQFMMLHEKPILIHSLQALAQIVDEIIVVAAAGETEQCQKMIADYRVHRVSQIVPGGNERQHSVYNGLRCCNDDTEIVVIHDGARPLISPGLVGDAINSARKYGAVSVAVPVKDTVKIVNAEGFVRETPDRSRLWLIQTPQAFDYQLILRAHLAARQQNFTGTDDASLVERIGHPVKLIEGSYDNIKITTPEDILVAEALLARRL